MKRTCIIVLDSMGIGALDDAADYGDLGSNTIGHIAERMLEAFGAFNIPNLEAMGLGNIDGITSLKKAESTVGAYGRLLEASKGKDTTTGHWEIAGLYTDVPFQTFPNGFPSDFMEAYEKAIGTKTLGNVVASGTDIIESLGDEHESTGYPIIYTSADSVFQIAANTAVIPLEKLYFMCQTARDMLKGDMSIGRVIARPYVKDESGKRVRTSDRRDYSVMPPSPTMLNYVKDSGRTVYSVGKISDIFDGYGVSLSSHIVSNMDGVDKTIQALNTDFEGLIFTNLVDFDAKYGHRRDPIGYGKAIEEFDSRLPELRAALKPEDIMILCADHGNDPVHEGFNHTREAIPVLVCGAGVKGNVNLGTGKTFANISATVLDYLGIENKLPLGDSFLKEIIK